MWGWKSGGKTTQLARVAWFWGFASHCASTAACFSPVTWGIAVPGRVTPAGTAPLRAGTTAWALSPPEMLQDKPMGTTRYEAELPEQAGGETYSSSSPLPPRSLPIPTVSGRVGSSSQLIWQDLGNNEESQVGAWVSWCWSPGVCPLALCTLRACSLSSCTAAHQYLHQLMRLASCLKPGQPLLVGCLEALFFFLKKYSRNIWQIGVSGHYLKHLRRPLA